jgi:hypothetical protein
MSRWKLKRSRKSEQKKSERREERGRSKEANRPEEEAPPIHNITMGMPGSPFKTTIGQVSSSDVPALARYYKAHSLLPRNYVFDARERRYRRIVTMAVDLLRDPKAKKKSRTRAIVILGHSPSPIAIHALEALASSDLPQADLARMALDECLSLAEQFPANLGGYDGSSAAGTMN